MFIHGLDWLYRLLNLPDYFRSFSFPQLVYLQNVERDPLVDDIKYATGLDSFAYNKYCDVEDFIYADKDIAFPQFINLLSCIHHIQTFDSDKGSTDENYLGFKAKRDVRVIIIAEKSNNYSNKKLSIRDLVDVESPVLRLIIHHFRRFDIWYYELNEGEDFNLKGLGSKKFAPIIFIYE